MIPLAITSYVLPGNVLRSTFNVGADGDPGRIVGGLLSNSGSYTGRPAASRPYQRISTLVWSVAQVTDPGALFWSSAALLSSAPEESFTFSLVAAGVMLSASSLTFLQPARPTTKTSDMQITNVLRLIGKNCLVTSRTYFWYI